MITDYKTKERWGQAPSGESEVKLLLSTKDRPLYFVQPATLLLRKRVGWGLILGYILAVGGGLHDGEPSAGSRFGVWRTFG